MKRIKLFEQFISEVTTNDWHFKAIMAVWDKGGSFTRKKIGSILLKDPSASRREIEDALRTSDYEEVTGVTDMLRLENIEVYEEFIEEFKIPSGRWVEMDLKKIDKEGMQTIWDMYTRTYLDAGLDLSADDWQEMQSKYKATAIKDVDSDNEPDAFIIYKPTQWGNKIALLGTNGKKAAKSDIVKKLLELVNTRGWFIEASMRTEELLSQSNAPVVKDEEVILGVVGSEKKPEFTKDGYYTRFLSKAGKRITKRIYGRLK